MRPLGGHRRPPPGTASNTAATISLSSKAEDLKSLLETAAAILVLAHQVQQHQQLRKRKVAKDLNTFIISYYLRDFVFLYRRRCQKLYF